MITECITPGCKELTDNQTQLCESCKKLNDLRLEAVRLRHELDHNAREQREIQNR